MKIIYYAKIFIVFCLLHPPSVAALSNGRELAAENTATNLFKFLVTPRTKIGTDLVAQRQWLTPELIKLLANTRATVQAARKVGKEEMGPDPSEPYNGTFFHKWDFPSACEVTSSKFYKSELLVFVYCGWGKGTDGVGSSETYTLVMKQHSEQWLVDDITFSDDVKGRSTLRRELQDTIALAKRFLSKGRW